MTTAEEKLTHARDLALKAMAARDCTRKELLELLLGKRVSPRIAEAALAELESVRVVDDDRVARVYAARRLDEGIAGTLLEAELLDRGVDPSLVESILAESLTGRDEPAEALELAREKVRTSPARLEPDAIRRRTFAFLIRRGFEEDVAHAAVERASEEYLGRP